MPKGNISRTNGQILIKFSLGIDPKYIYKLDGACDPKLDGACGGIASDALIAIAQVSGKPPGTLVDTPS